MTEKLEALIIGSGFGGGISACRLGKKWPGKVAVIERGKRYPLGSFPRTPHDMAKNFWNYPEDSYKRPKKIRQKTEMRGLFDIRNYSHMDAVVCAGYGGGSLIYANVFLEPPDHIFDERWPESCKKSHLDYYYGITKKVLGARPIPQNKDPRRDVSRTQYFINTGKKLGYDAELVDINVFFGNDLSNPTPIGVQEKNRYGALQTSCTYCGECDIGCNFHSKNTIDLNYLFVAENRYHVKAYTEHLAEKIVPIDQNDQEDCEQTGKYGYKVYVRDLISGKSVVFLCKRLIISAGTLGSNELLLRAKYHFKTLSRLSKKLGHGFSGNGDFLSTILGIKQTTNPNYGPVITQKIDHHLYKNFNKDKAFIMEDAAYPALLAWFIEGEKPGILKLRAIWTMLRNMFAKWVLGNSPGEIGYALADLLKYDISSHTSVHLCMGIDRSDGILSLDSNGYLNIDWPYKNSMSLYNAINEMGRKFKSLVEGESYMPLPTWFLPWRKNITVHPLGGCTLSMSPETGVCSANRKDFGQVFGYENLYCADGSLLPTAVGANPIATISALSEMVMEGITEIKPDDNL